MTGAADAFAPLMRDVAVALLGKPENELHGGKQLRWGSRGSFKIDLPEGLWHDKEANEGGGVLKLVMRERGCDKAGALQWMEGNGFIEPRAPDQAKAQRQFYDYRDEQGTVLFRVERRPTDPRFLQHGPDGKGGFVCRPGCMKGVRKVLYRLDRLIAASTDQIVFFTEGEKDCDRLLSLGLVATTNPAGAGKYEGLADCIAEYLAGRRVVILEDNDEAGASHVANGLKAIGSSAAIVAGLKLDGLKAKGDVSDWLDAGGSAAELVALAETALARDTTDTAMAYEATPYQWIEPDQIPMRPWVLGRWLLRGTVAAVIAPGGIGKTTLICGTALSMVTGRPLLGKAVWEGQKRVWLWNLEDPLLELQRSIQASALRWGVGQDELAGRLFVDTAMEGRGLCTAVENDGGFKVLAPVYEAITAELIRRKIDVLVIDPFVSSHEVEENANSKIDKIAKAWGRVANAANCVIVLVHHTSKAGAAEVTALSARGAKALTDACRSALVLNRMSDDEADRFGFDDKERRRYFTVQDDKHNRAPAENADWFHLESVELGNGGLGEGDSIGVAVPWQTPDPFEGLTLNHLYLAQCEVEKDECRADAQSPEWVGHAVARALTLDGNSVKDRKRITSLMRTWIENGAFKEVVKKDKKSKDRKFVVVGKWANDLSSSPS